MATLENKIKDIHAKKEVSMRNNTDLDKLYEAAKNLDPAKAMRLVQQAQNDEERKFYAFIADMNLQRSQKEVIERNLF